MPPPHRTSRPFPRLPEGATLRSMDVQHPVEELSKAEKIATVYRDVLDAVARLEDLVGLYAISPAKAKEWAAMTRKERAEVRVAHKGESATAQRLYNNAESNFNYRVVKNSGRVVKADKTVEPLKLTRAQRAAVQACMDLGITMKVYGQAIALLK